LDLGHATISTTGTGELTRIALDTNVLVYAENIGISIGDEAKVDRALLLYEKLTARARLPVVALQSLAELHRVLVRKSGLDAEEISARLKRWRSSSEQIATDEAIFDAALQLASDHKLQIYDAIILAAAVHARCDLLLSEDLQDGFAWRGVTVANPFAATLEPRLARLLA
jgi:predicted nucleic acid-binding protein